MGAGVMNFNNCSVNPSDSQNKIEESPVSIFKKKARRKSFMFV
jgi:hypothetical protein